MNDISNAVGSRGCGRITSPLLIAGISLLIAACTGIPAAGHHGPKVVKVVPNSEADWNGITPGDEIIALNGVTIFSTEELRAAVEKGITERRRTFQVVAQNNGQRRFVVMPPFGLDEPIAGMVFDTQAR